MDLAIIIAVVVVALAFDYTNGFHDAANAIATSVSTRALTPRVALALAAVMNFVGAFLGQKVATTVSDTIDPGTGAHGLVIVMAGLLGAITWNMITWYFGLPSSSSHALIGGLVGAAIAAGVTVSWDTVIQKVVIPMLLSPIVAFAAGFVVMIAIMWGFRKRNPHRLNRGFRLAQTASAAGMALGHGLQDAQKTMGVIFLALLTGEYVSSGDPLPIWVIVAAATAISAGTWAGGWRIMRTLGRRIIELDPPRGFAAESVAASVLYTTAYVFEAPISTTHTITSAVMGAGATKRFSAVRWGVVRSILTAWVLTFPMAGSAAALVYFACRFVFQLP
ncbi:anion permease [Nocardioides sp.]|uniref:inorganic phosphate transporter n=1 Tax=Nocardioides sp. TaxID=35761 RepID=UPI003569EBE0